MMRMFALMAALSVAFLTGPTLALGYDDFNGSWRNDDPSASDLTRVVVNQSGGTYRVRAFGKCHPSDCDWGEVGATIYSDSAASSSASSRLELIATYRTGFSESILILDDQSGNRVGYSLYTRFTDRSGRRAYVVHGTLVRDRGWRSGGGGPGGPYPGGSGGGMSYGEDCTGLDWSSAALARVGGQWMVVDGTHQLLAFGSNAVEASIALQIIRHYRFTQHCFIGRPNPSMDYWKVGDSVPSDSMSGADCISNNPDTTRAQYASGEWKLVDGTHWLVSFGSNEAEARQAEEVVRHYRLSRECFVGRPHPSMTYWLAQ